MIWTCERIRAYRALKFGEKVGSGSLLIHCHWGISRSSGIALALIAKGLGKGREFEAVKTLERINPYCRPNALLVYLTDEILGRGGALFKATSSRVNLTGSMKPSFDYWPLFYPYYFINYPALIKLRNLYELFPL